jgi:hypothetical protein
MTALGAARRAVELGDWELALAVLGDAEPGPDEAVELRATAYYATGDLAGCLAAWELLHARRRALGDRDGAARAAAAVALHLLVDTGLMAPVRGWVTRAERMLDDTPPGPVHAMLAMVKAYERLLSGDLTSADRFATEAIALGEQHDVVAATVIGQVARARLLALTGRVEEGVHALDEAGARLMAGIADPLTTGLMLCEIVCAAQGLAMPDLARQWTDAMEQWGRGAALGSIGGRCRIHRAELLRISGPCDQAESVALAACDELRPWLRREYGWPLVELGTIRLRKGDLRGAEEAFTSAEALAWSAQPGLALLRLAQGEARAASVLIADAIAHPPELPWKERPPKPDLQLAPLLDAQVEIAAATGDTRLCATAAGRLSRIAENYPSPGLAASAALARARAALLAGEAGTARRLALEAARQWADLAAPYESANALVVAATAAATSGLHEVARDERAAAARTFACYGAAARAAQLERLPAEGRPEPPPPIAAAFRREGGVRVVAFGGARFTLPDLRGYRYLEQLLRRPGEDIAAVDLVAGERGGVVVQHGLPALDSRARAEYRRRLREVEEDVAEANDMNDLARLALAERDRQFLVAELARAVGIDGRIRIVGDDAERARTSVFRALHYAIDRLGTLDAALGQHLRLSVRTGSWCSYAPDALTRIRWDGD